MNVIEGKMTQDGIKVGIVVARFNEFITSKLLGGSKGRTRKTRRTGGKHRRSMGAGSIRDTTHRKEDGKKWKI